MEKETENKEVNHILHSSHKEIEGFRRLGARIGLKAPQAKVITVLSGDPGDGKTELVVKLANYYASTGKKVLLIDGDLRHNNLEKIFRTQSKVGFEDGLARPGNIKTLIRVTDRTNVSVLPVISPSNISTELLDNPELGHLIENLKADYDIILIDSLSLKDGMDGYLLARVSDGVVFLVVKHQTTKDLLESSREILKEAAIPVIGYVLK